IDPAGRKPTVAAAETGRRTVVFDGGPVDTPVYWRDHLPLDAVIDGPTVIEQMDCTTLVEPGDRARGDAHGNLIVDIGGLS
ncbi:MAG: hydantoinase/oxoprolinase family protein, partial [Rhodospirillaceae bacterium]